MPSPFDVVGNWTEVKEDIIREYAVPYAKILSRQSWSKGFAFIDAMAGPGHAISKTTGSLIAGSPAVALAVEPRFDEFHFIESDPNKADELPRLVSGRPEAHVYRGDCNRILIDEIFPKFPYVSRKRALCVIDPYKLNLNWELFETAGKLKTIYLILNFPVMDMNMNVLLQNPSGVRSDQSARMNAFWGDDSWRAATYNTQFGMLGEDRELKGSPTAIINAFKQRLVDKAGFEYVAEPIPMRTPSGAIVYWLFFASNNSTALKIAEQVFKKHRSRTG